MLRVSIALMIWVDVWIRIQTLVAHYTDEGVLPRTLQQELYLSRFPGRFSFHMLSGDAWLPLGLFGLMAVFALLVGLGYRTRFFLFCVWLLTVSLHNRNEMIETGGDALLRMTCFWAMFLPLGGLASLDVRAGRVRKAVQLSVLSWATFGFMMQLCFVYWFSAIHKSHPQWRSEFTAVHYAMHIDSYATAFGTWLRQYRGLTRGMTVGVLGFEFLGPFLLFGAGLLSLVPGMSWLAKYQAPVRTFGVFGFVALHFGLGLGLSLGTFSWFAMLIWLSVLPAEFWEDCERLRSRFVPRVRWLSGLTQPAWGAEIESTRMRRALGRVSGAAAIAAFLCVFLLNLRTVSRARVAPYLDGRAAFFLPDLNFVLNALRLDQHWGLFAPNPRVRDGWFVLLGAQEDGRQVNLLRPDQPLSWEVPQLAASTYETFRWRKYYRDLRRDGGGARKQRPYYLGYYCRTWNSAHHGQERVERLELVYMERRTLREGGHSAPQPISLVARSCREVPAIPPMDR